jgi:hypothetical protein
MFGQGDGWDDLVADYEAIGGSAQELAEQYERDPESVIELAAAYGIDEDDLGELTELVESETDKRTSRDGGAIDLAIKRGLEAGLSPDDIKDMYLSVLDEIRADSDVAELAMTEQAPGQAAAMDDKVPEGGEQEPGPMPDDIRSQLENWLDAGRSMKEFFEITEDVIGPPSQYTDLHTLLEDDREWLDRVTGG